jgi:hypothetical protein
MDWEKYTYDLKIIDKDSNPINGTNITIRDSFGNVVVFNGTNTTGNMLRYRRLHWATELRNGKILITGGFGGTSNTANVVLGNAELYDPATGTFSWTAGPLNTARRSHQAILLYTGKVLIAGGSGVSGLLNSAEKQLPGKFWRRLTRRAVRH